MAGPDERWRRAQIAPTLYDVGVKHERVARMLGQLMWGADVQRLYDDIERLGALPEHTSVLDLPCGGGVAFRGIPAGRELRYVAADLSRTMLARARAEGAQRGLSKIDFVEADVEGLPFADGEFDLCISYNGIHCFGEPHLALAELARVLRPGGVLRASTVVTGSGLRQDALVAAYQRLGIFGACVSQERLERLLADAGFVDIGVERTGALAFCSARGESS